jgi:hypothetical protein
MSDIRWARVRESGDAVRTGGANHCCFQVSAEQEVLAWVLATQQASISPQMETDWARPGLACHCRLLLSCRDRARRVVDETRSTHTHTRTCSPQSGHQDFLPILRHKLLLIIRTRLCNLPESLACVRPDRLMAKTGEDGAGLGEGSMAPC